jgi:hypothetical protein
MGTSAFKHKTKVGRDHLICGIGMSRVAEKGEINKGMKGKTARKKDGVG